MPSSIGCSSGPSRGAGPPQTGSCTDIAGDLKTKTTRFYAIPDELINAIQAEIPRFFTKKELQFERDLNATVGGGLFLGSPFEHPGLPTRRLTDLEKQYFELADQRPVSLALEQITTDQLRAAGNSDDQVRLHRAYSTETVNRIVRATNCLFGLAGDGRRVPKGSLSVLGALARQNLRA